MGRGGDGKDKKYKKSNEGSKRKERGINIDWLLELCKRG
jgi:hypothetical protein